MSWIVSPRKKNEWEYRWYDQSGRVRSKRIPGKKNKTEAKRIQRAWDAKREERIDLPKKEDWSLGQAYAEVLKARKYALTYLENLKTYWGTRETKDEVKEGQFSAMKSNLGIIPYFGKEARLSKIGVGDILRWIGKLKEEEDRTKKDQNGETGKGARKDTTANHYRNALSRAFNLAKAHGVVAHNPCRHPEVNQQLEDDTEERDRVATPEEIKSIFANASSNTKTFLIIAWATSGRKSEILSLEYDDLLYAENGVRFEHNPSKGKWVKGKKTKVVRVDPAIIEYVRKHHKRIEGSNWIFAHGGKKRRGQRIKDNKKGIEGAVKRAGLEGITAHILRHSSASFLGANGAPLPTIRDHLRHGDFRMTSRYSHGIDKEKERAGNVLLQALIGMDACLDACAGSKMEEFLQRLRNDPEVVSAVKSIRKRMKEMERETGFEPATLSLGS